MADILIKTENIKTSARNGIPVADETPECSPELIKLAKILYRQNNIAADEANMEFGYRRYLRKAEEVLELLAGAGE